MWKTLKTYRGFVMFSNLTTDSPPHSLGSSSLLSSPLSSSITSSLFHSRLKTYLFNKSFHLRLLLPTGLPSWQRDWTGPIMLIVLFLVSHFNFLFVPCGGLSWLPVSFLLHVKYTLSYRIVSYRIVTERQKTYKFTNYLDCSLYHTEISG